MEFRTLNVVATELSICLDFTNMVRTLHTLSNISSGIVWVNGGNCRMVTGDQLRELFRTATLSDKIESETDIKKGQPLQHKIYWDDCPALPSDITQLF